MLFIKNKLMTENIKFVIMKKEIIKYNNK